MNKHYTILLFAGFLFFLNVNAQISAGGEPYSFSHPELTSDIEIKTMPPLDIAAIIAEDEALGNTPRPYKFAQHIFVNLSLENSGTWEEVENGRIWRLGINSPGAYSLNFVFDEFYLPKNSTFFIYTPEKDYLLGAYTDFNNHEERTFGTDLMKGETAILEYFEPSEFYGQGIIRLGKVSHGYKDIFSLWTGHSTAGSGSCNNDVNCPEWADWQDDKRSVGIMLSNNNIGSAFCTGAMVVDVPHSGTPYFLTANHCLGGSMTNWVFRFNYERIVCNQNGVPTSQTVQGATLRASWATSDFALLQLNQTPPSNYNVYYAGWTNDGIAATQSTGIHHPSGDVKKISRENSTLISTTWFGTPNTHWENPGWDDGVTEPGSSGSPLFDQNHRIVGQLHGGQSQCGNPANMQNDVYGKFSVSWNGNNTNSSRLKNWLDPNNTGAVAVDGWDPNAPVYANDARMQSISIPVANATYCTPDITPSVVIKNMGSTTLTSLDITYNIDGGSNTVFNWTGSLATNATESVTLSQVTLASGTHTLKVFTTNPNGNADENTSNDTLSVSFIVVADGNTAPIPLFTSNTQQTCQGMQVVFTNQSISCETATYAWTFQNGSPSTSTLPNPTVTYNTVGTFNVRLIATNQFGSDTLLMTSYITVISAPELTVTSTVDHIGAPPDGSATVQVFSGTPPYTYVWSNGQSSTSASPTNTITGLAAGNYNVQVTDGNGCIVSKSILVGTNTGLEEETLAALINIFPNPANNLVTVEIPAGKNAGVCELYNIIGEAIQSFNAAAQQRFNIDLSNYTTGVYFLRINIDGHLITKKIILAKE